MGSTKKEWLPLKGMHRGTDMTTLLGKEAKIVV